MIALIAGEEATRKGTIYYALQHGGFEARPACSPDEAERIVQDHGSASCVLTIDAGTLSTASAAQAWAKLLSDHPRLSAVVTTHAAAGETARQATRGANRILLESPFDAAAVVAGVRRALGKRAAQEAGKMKPVRRTHGAARRQRASPSAPGS